ncbi:hypothetical protein HKX48_000566 [Thoreauomyces humboldtii]|nr:hypothetical protein HKX48_000566 [Thoreauomyces humboldtii]
MSQYNSNSTLAAPESFSERRKSERSMYDRPSRELMDELRNGPVMASNVGLHAEVSQNFRDVMLSKGGSSGSLFGDGMDAATSQKRSW